ncbi:MAG: FAD:protein transferase [Candidatus Saccharibacteria bacterium]|nr:FAD:protein transferase [Candidatus Saccharibacteria bacterium]
MESSLKHTFSFEAIGTHWSITTERVLSEDVKMAIRTRIEAFDKTYSRFRKDSLVTDIARRKGTFEFPEDAIPLFAFYRKLYDLTGGKVTPLIGSMLEKAGYDADYSLRPKTQEALPDWDDVLEINGSTVTTTQPVTLDVGAAGKGYIVDIICKILDVAGIAEYVVDASGDLRHKGHEENRVGLEDPREPGKVIGVIDVQNQSLCASAINRRKWGKYHHVFDPDMKDSTKGVMATWVIADSTMIADGIATSLFFVDPNVIRKEFAFEFARMRDDGGVEYSPVFEKALF